MFFRGRYLNCDNHQSGMHSISSFPPDKLDSFSNVYIWSNKTPRTFLEVGTQETQMNLAEIHVSAISIWKMKFLSFHKGHKLTHRTTCGNSRLSSACTSTLGMKKHVNLFLPAYFSSVILRKLLTGHNCEQLRGIDIFRIPVQLECRKISEAVFSDNNISMLAFSLLFKFPFESLWSTFPCESANRIARCPCMGTKRDIDFGLQKKRSCLE